MLTSDFPEGGSCVTPEGLKIMDALRIPRGPRNEPRKQARIMCGKCPTFKNCRKWVLETEEPVGSYGSIVAGLSIEDRKYIRKERKEDEKQRSRSSQQDASPPEGGANVGE